MGNKQLRPSEDDPMRGFDEQQLLYLAEKFELISNQSGFVDATKLVEAYQCDPDEAGRILRYIDFEGEGQVDFYEFKCAAASIHQNDEQAQQMIFGVYTDGSEMSKQHFEQFFKTVYKYLQYVGVSKVEYSQELGEKKFTKYDYNGNGSISLQEFRDILKNDSECRTWMQVLGFAKQTDEVRAKDAKEEEQEQRNERGDFEVDAEEGDQAGSTPSWIKTIDYMKPKGYVAPPNLNTVPSTNIEIEYVYGYRSYDTRNNLRYSTKGEAVYHTAGTGIVLNQAKNTMRTTTVHNDDITCLDSWKNLVVTGEMGRRPLIAVWDTDTMEVIVSFSKPLEKSISNVAFSPSGKYIAATSMSDNHEIAIYDVIKKELVATGNGPRSPIFALKFTQEEDKVVCGCAKEIVFANFSSGKGLKLERGIFGKVPIIPTYSLARVGGYMVSAMGNGNILLWKGNSCTKPLKEHNVAVTALTQTHNGGLVSGDAEGNIVIWNSNLSADKKMSVQKLISPKVSFQPKVIALVQREGALLIGTRGGEIIEVILASGKATVVMEGHYDKQLWGLTCHPNKNEFFTAGQDRLLIKWDIAKRRATQKKQLEAQVMSIDLNPRENLLAVGYRNGLVVLLDCTSLKSLSKISNHKNPDKEVLSLVKFSPSGELLAIAYCPPISKIYIYQTSNRKKIGECRGSPSRITCIDFSMAGDFLIANNTSYEILFYNAQNGNQVTRATQFQDEQWATMSCKFSWQCQGVWPHLYADGSNINVVERSHSKQLLASGDDFSKIKLFRYPACQPKQFFNQFKGHSSHITGVKWSYDDRYLVSIGGLEKSVIQWKVIESKQDIIYEYEEEKQSEEEKVEDDGDYDVEAEYVEQPTSKKSIKEEGDFAVDDADGDEIGAIKPFLGQIKFPSGFVMNKALQDVLPKERLRLKYAWGIRNQYINDEVRSQLKYGEKGNTCIFITASVGVEMDTKSLSQTFYNVQTNDLICLSVSNDRKLAATGQMAEQNKDKRSIAKVDVHVWTTEDKKTQAILRCCHKRAVVVVEFSPNGQLLLTIGQDDKNSLKVFNWRSGKLQWPEQPTSRAKATGACWKDNREYATVGLDHIKFWSEGKGSMGKINGGKWDPMFCVTQVDGKYFSGGGSGGIYLWAGGNGTRVQAHKKGKVHTLIVDSRKNLYSGGDDGSIIYWKVQGNNLNKQAEVVNMATLSSLEPGVLSLDLNKTEDRILVCTKGSEIFQVNLKKPAEENCLMKSHFAGELWACCFSPDSKEFVSAGDDSTLRVYDVESKKMLYHAKLETKIRGVDWQSSTGEYIVCGDYKGKIHLFDSKLTKLDTARTLFSRMKPRQEPFWIEDIKFSPDGKQVAFGAHGGRSHIEVFKVEQGKFGESFTLGVGFSSALLHLDWSRDGEFIIAASQAYELKFATVAKAGSKNADASATSMKDEKWATWTCKLGFPVQGIWQGSDYTDINTVCASPSRRLLATGGDDQKIRLFQYPVVIPKQKNRQYTGHASHVTRVRFSHDQENLLSTGGNDRTTMLWIVEGLDKEAISKQLIEPPEEEEKEEAGEEGEEDEFDQNEIDIPVDRSAMEANAEANKKEKDPDEIEVDEDIGTQFMAVKPWVGAIKEPTKEYYKSNGDEPPIRLVLEYAHGYRAKDCRNNLRYIDADTVVYHTAALGVMMKVEGAPRRQSFFDRHGDDILSIAWSEDRKTMYTGQIGPNPPIYEWNTEGKSERSYKGIKKGVMALDCNDKYLVAASMDDDHTVCVFDRKSCKNIAKDKGGPEVILAMKFVAEDRFVTVGVKHFKMWEIKGATVTGKKGLFGKNCNFLVCVDSHEQKAYVGAGDGSLQVWTGTSCQKSVKLHGGKPMDAVKCLQRVLLTGGKDGIVNIVAIDTLATIASVKCEEVLKDSKCVSVRSVDALDNKLLIGTLGSQIYQITCDARIDEATEDTDFSKAERLLSAHFSSNPKFTNEVWGLTVPLENTSHFITCSDDATLRLWDLQNKEEIASARLDFDQNLKKIKKNATTGDWADEAKGRCLAVSRDGYIIVGCKDGSIKIFDDNLKPLSSTAISKKEISDIKISREDDLVAIGSHDAFIYLCSWKAPSLKVKYRMKKHSSYITHLDFSCDGNYLHSTCGAYELLFWDANKGQQCTSGATMLRDEGWYTWTATLGWPVQGVWSKFMDGTDINAVDRSRLAYEDNLRFVATGNDHGQVRVFEYPCISKGTILIDVDSRSIVGKGHSSHVTSVRFTPEDKYIISSGGADHTLMQWRIEKS